MVVYQFEQSEGMKAVTGNDGNKVESEPNNKVGGDR